MCGAHVGWVEWDRFEPLKLHGRPLERTLQWGEARYSGISLAPCGIDLSVDRTDGRAQ